MAQIIYLPTRKANQLVIAPPAETLASVEHDPVQLHAQAHNALAMVVHYLRQPQANVPGAARKAQQALAAFRCLDVACCR